MRSHYTPSEVSVLKRIIAQTCVVRLPLATAPGECYISIRQTTPEGYARMNVRRKHKRVHRVAYEIIVGPIPEGYEPDHLCRQVLCWRPEHLEAVTQNENFRRSNAPAAVNLRKTHCNNGHEFTDENTYRCPQSGRRRCLTCRDIYQRQYRITHPRSKAC